ncbi:MAG: protein kinase [Deltaproteobacteria bacterium]|nr:protein kinase [Deltaproteobacteria bacterium]NND28436.1 protein kinase [Myxococcales bacterium]MBT8466569.1 protein kinase [Deltaproteobacteria bacterium]MBT8482565.1 protein kinase [Deltaproteobacteria bacterium]NNK06082.1 protein kinase [Myxococcales bacterium]
MKVCPACRADYGGGEVFCPVDATRLVTTSQMSASPLDPNDPIIGTVLAGRYLVKSRIGEGGMGLVYEGVHRDIDKRVAIKVLRDDLSRRPEVVARFRQEAKSASRIGHENIVDIFDFGETRHGSSYFVMEFLEGEDLGNVLGKKATIEAERACEIVLQCCRALSATHGKGIVHRDIKPENIFLTTRDGIDDFVKIVDFGIAKMSDIETEGAPGRKLTKTGMIFGTPEYMSPEQAAGRDLDHRVDVYALGVIVYECLAGRVPFEGDTFMGILTQHLTAEAPAIDEVNPHAEVSQELELVIRKALAKSPEDRYQDTEELAEAIVCALDGRVSRATRRTPASVLASPLASPLDSMPRRKTSPWVWAAAVIGAAGLVAWSTLGSLAAPPSEAEASAAPLGPPPLTQTLETVEPPPPIADPLPEPAPTEVEVHVASDPPGAKISYESGSEACASTPCTLEVTRGATLVLHAKLGKRRGRTAITPNEEETVLIELQAPKRLTPKPRSAQVPKPRRQPPARSSDLKVPEWAQ